MQKETKRIPVIYSKFYDVDIGEHVFPTAKYKILKERIEQSDFLKDSIEFISPQAATDEELETVHTHEYINKLKSGKLTSQEILTLEVPFSKELVNASFICCGGTLSTARFALERKAAIHLGGGFHHAFPDHGEGFCVLNDVAVSVRVLQKEGLIKKALIVDCDLHQGNGTSFIFQEDSSVYTFSIHEENNYPFHKPKGSMDIGLEDYTDDSTYLKHLTNNIPKIIETFKPDVIIYLAGADPYEHDQLGKLALTLGGLRERDQFIYNEALRSGVPIAVTLAGGYAVNQDDTIKIHLTTVEECIRVFAEK